jgi:hypothetical protein
MPGFYKHAWQCQGPQAEAVRENLLAAAAQLDLPLGEGFRGFAKRPASQCRKVGDLKHSIRAAERTIVLHHPILRHGEQATGRLSQTMRAVIERTLAGSTNFPESRSR